MPYCKRCAYAVSLVPLRLLFTRANVCFSSLIALVKILLGPVPSCPPCMCVLVKCSSFVDRGSIATASNKLLASILYYIVSRNVLDELPATTRTAATAVQHLM
ncbi:hypothetical protein BKA83DRAFT_4178011, partial [Pisolithus microcarpus]